MDDEFLNSKKIKCTDTDEHCTGYKDYLKSMHWMKLRAKLIKSDTKCSHCQEKKHVYQLHHLHYKTLGHEGADDLLVLCVDCHKIVHAANYKPKADSKPKKTKTKKQPRIPKIPKEEMTLRIYNNTVSRLRKLDQSYLIKLRDLINEKYIKKEE